MHKALDLVFTPSYDDELSRVISEGKLDQAHRIVSSMLLETRDFPIEIYTITLSRIMVTVQGLLPLMFDDENRPDIQQLFSRLEQTVFFDDALDCLDRIFQGIQQAFETQRSSRTLNLVTEMKGFIEEHYGNHELSLDLIADRFGFTPTYLGRVFRKTACKTILDHITEVRMARARDLLENTDLRVADIAVQVVYSDSSYFHRAFKRHHLVSPMMYRNTYLERRPSS